MSGKTRFTWLVLGGLCAASDLFANVEPETGAELWQRSLQVIEEHKLQLPEVAH